MADFVGTAKAGAEAKANAKAELIAKIEKSILHFDEIKLSTRRRFLVRNIIPRTGLTVVWGAPKCGKSFWVYDLMMHVARGLRYRGQPVHQGPVVYCMFEGQGGADTRAEAYRQEKLKGDPSGPFYVETLTLDLVKNHEALIEAAKRKLGDQIPVGVVLDTLNRSLVGSESKDEDMSAYIRAAQAIIETFRCAVVVVHHCGHNGERVRGHSSLLGAEDAEISVKRLTDKTTVATVEKLKDGAEGEQITFTLKSVVVGEDEEGFDMSSCVAELCEAIKSGKSWPKGLALIREVIAEAILQAGAPHRVGGDGPNVKAVPLQAARDVHERRYVSTGTGDRAVAERKAWSRNFRQAQAGNLIAGEVKDGTELIWLVT
jgi:hypothetical protein